MYTSFFFWLFSSDFQSKYFIRNSIHSMFYLTSTGLQYYLLYWEWREKKIPLFTYAQSIQSSGPAVVMLTRLHQQTGTRCESVADDRRTLRVGCERCHAYGHRTTRCRPRRQWQLDGPVSSVELLSVWIVSTIQTSDGANRKQDEWRQRQMHHCHPEQRRIRAAKIIIQLVINVNTYKFLSYFQGVIFWLLFIYYFFFGKYDDEKVLKLEVTDRQQYEFVAEIMKNYGWTQPIFFCYSSQTTLHSLNTIYSYQIEVGNCYFLWKYFYHKYWIYNTNR